MLLLPVDGAVGANAGLPDIGGLFDAVLLMLDEPVVFLPPVNDDRGVSEC